MDMTNALLYLLINAFHIYVFYYIYTSFLGRRSIPRRREFACFAAFYAVNSAAFLLVNHPLLNLLTSLLPLFLIALIYSQPLGIKLIVGLLSYLFSCIFEVLALNLMMSLNPSMVETNPIIGNLISSLFLFWLALLLKNFVHKQGLHTIKFIHWVSIILLPSGSLILILMTLRGNYGFAESNVIMIFLFLFNVLVFYLYEEISSAYQKDCAQRMEQQSAAANDNLLQLIEEGNLRLRALRHDLDNHITAVHHLVSAGDTDGALDYLSRLTDIAETPTEFSNSGNTVIDSILNYKLSAAKQLGAAIDLKICVPYDLPLEQIDAWVILGNLLNNALDALKGAAEKILDIQIAYGKGILFAEIRNSYSGARNKVRGKSGSSSYLSTKPDAEAHGFGLRNVQEYAAKYDGELTIQDDGSFFTASVLLYMDIEPLLTKRFGGSAPT